MPPDLHTSTYLNSDHSTPWLAGLLPISGAEAIKPFEATDTMVIPTVRIRVIIDARSIKPDRLELQADARMG